jgi:aspartyl-tRNA(Asn)/glutamyl-tRNA(Gln) amidotransferase subunit C
MSITREQVLKTASLAYLDLEPEEVATFTAQLSAILDYVGQLSELDTSDVPPMSHSTLGADVDRSRRADVPRPSLGADAATACAPESMAGYFKVPNVIAHARGGDRGEYRRAQPRPERIHHGDARSSAARR